MKPVRTLLTLAFLFSALITRAGVYTVETVPSPKVQGQHFYVSNPDSILSPETVSNINDMLCELDKATEVEVAVVAINDWEYREYSSTYGFALDLFNHWSIGKADKNTGVLVVLAVEPRDIEIITGKGIEGILTDAECGYILDENIDYLADDDWDGGLYHITKDISTYLMLDDNRSELLLGWHPKGQEKSVLITLYLMLGCIIMILLAIWTYKRWQGKPGQTGPEINKQGENARGCTGCLMFIFPFPLLFLYLYQYIAGKRLKAVPLNCPKCGSQMDQVPQEEADTLLTEPQRKEQELYVNTFYRWRCPKCNEEELLIKEGVYHKRYEKCPECGGLVGKLTDNKTIKRPTQYAGGKQRNFYTCQCCGHKWDKVVELSRLHSSSSSSYSSSSSSSYGGSWSSSSSSSWSSGSWGGGSSSGGGAGRHF